MSNAATLEQREDAPLAAPAAPADDQTGNLPTAVVREAIRRSPRLTLAARRISNDRLPIEDRMRRLRLRVLDQCGRHLIGHSPGTPEFDAFFGGDVMPEVDWLGIVRRYQQTGD